MSIETITLATFSLFMALYPLAQAEVRVSKMFTDHMVLQRDMAVPVWGTAEPGETITVQFAGQTKTTQAAADGRWLVRLDPLAVATESREMTVAAATTVTFKDVLVGEVWLASGQSNMEMPVGNKIRGDVYPGVINFEEEVRNAAHPRLRLFKVNRQSVPSPLSDVPSDGWRISTPESAELFSAVAYFYGRSLTQALDIPVGIIASAASSSRVEQWTSIEALARFPQFAEAVDYYLHADFARIDREGRQKWRIWQQELEAKANDAALMQADYSPSATNIDDWPTAAVPGQLDRFPAFRNFRGALWLAREFDVAPEIDGATFKLKHGIIYNTGTVWINGERIGATAYNDRQPLAVPPNLLLRGRNRIVIRAVTSSPSFVGIAGTAADLGLEDQNGGRIALDGDWHYQIENGFDPAVLPAEPYWRVTPEGSPSCLFNGGIAPVIPYAIRGAIWYQGESNSGRAVEYRQLLPNLIADWRARWAQPTPLYPGAPGRDFAFYQVQLAGFRSIPENPGEDSWAELREAQRLVARTVVNAGMATAIDIGMAHFIHPLNKQEVGRRLGLVALAKTYGATAEHSGPEFKRMEIQDNRAVLHFDHVGGGLFSRNTEKPGTLSAFAVAGVDRVWHWAEAVVDRETVVVSCSAVAVPVAMPGQPTMSTTSIIRPVSPPFPFAPTTGR